MRLDNPSTSWICLNVAYSPAPYRGMNIFLLEAGGNVKKGGKSHIVVFWKWLEKEEEESEKMAEIPYLRYYRVFEINSQVEGLESKRKEMAFDHNPIERAEEMFKGYINAPDYTFYSGKAVYYPTVDKINCPPWQQKLASPAL